MRFSHSLGMIWSVSTSDRSRGTARPVTIRTGSIAQDLQVGRRREAARDRGGRRDRRATRDGCARPGPGGPRSCGSRWRRSARRTRADRGSCRGTSNSRSRATRSRPSVKTRSRPSASAWCFTRREPGTTSARRPGSTRRPSSTAAAARRSSIREFVHEPMNTVSTSIERIGVPGLEAHVGERPRGRLPLGRRRQVVGARAPHRRWRRPGPGSCPTRRGAGSRRRRGRPRRRSWPPRR